MSRIIENRKKVRASDKRLFRPVNKPNTFKPIPVKKVQQVPPQLQGVGPGKHPIQISVAKKDLNVKEGQVLQQPDGLYKVVRISRGCSAQRNAIIYCDPFDSKTQLGNKILTPKKL